ncbi:MAG: DUF3619 family protein [Limnobacter sp.]|nr:DUF3619 family protein [Limnobacter sp.]
MTDEFQTGLKVRALLDESANALPPHIQLKLNAAVAAALKVQKVEVPGAKSARVAKASTGSALNNWLNDTFGWMNKPVVSFAMSAMFVLVAAVGVIEETSSFEDKRLGEFAEVDAEILGDDLPTEAFLDPGFVNYSGEVLRRSMIPVEEPELEVEPSSETPAT